MSDEKREYDYDESRDRVKMQIRIVFENCYSQTTDDCSYETFSKEKDKISHSVYCGQFQRILRQNIPRLKLLPHN